ncbi:MAG: LacI family DNA-binding transcriptional regulator [Lachnospiraceae bacterium]|nr:LacI family DNA-binding transcriptional regulator [Lachnospiraceae bacterium]
MAKEVKMKDIAERLHISTMTVSKALSGKPGVSESLRERIKALAMEMGYVFPRVDKNSEKKSYNIGVLLAEYYTEKYITFYWKLYQNINMTAVKQNCFVMLEILNSEDEKNLTIPKLVCENKIDGLLVLGGIESSYLKMLNEKVALPIVYMDFYDDSIHEDSIISNNFYGTYQITNYLFQKGHREIAFVGTLFSTKSITDRFLGYEKAMMEHGERIKQEWIIPDRESERETRGEITLPDEMPTAFVCNCDLTASTLIKKLQEAGYRVPEDISVVGFDDYLYPGACNVGVTSYGVNMEHMAAKGVEVMIHKLEGVHHHKGLHIVDGYLIEKESVLEKKSP